MGYIRYPFCDKVIHHKRKYVKILNRFKLHLKNRGLSQHTIKSYITTAYRFYAWIEQVYGKFEITAITFPVVSNYHYNLIENNNSAATINHTIDVLNIFFSWAQTEGIIKVNPVTGIKRMAVQENTSQWLDQVEQDILIREVQRHGKSRDLVLVMLLLYTGLRIAEAVSLRLTDITFSKHSGFIRVPQHQGDKFREVPLNTTLLRELQSYINETPQKWLFPGRRGGHITTRTAEKIVAKYGQLVKINVTPKILRHTFGKMLVDSGENLNRVATLMGYSTKNAVTRYTES